MSLSAWIMLLIGAVILYGGLIASLLQAMRKSKHK
jgi:hypothetical protein